MLRPLILIWRDPSLRLAAALLVVMGASVASIIPFQSIIAIEILGFSDAGYAVVLALDAVLGVAAAVYVGVLTDARSDRRTVSLIAACLGMVGTTLMWLSPSILTFFLTHALIYPLGGALFTQTFALIRLASEEMPQDDRDSVLSAVRAFLAVPFLAVLPVWSLVFQGETSLLVVYVAILALQVLTLALVAFGWPSDRTAGWATEKSDLSIRQGLAELARGPVVVRVFAMGAIISGLPIYMAVLGLAFESVPERSRSETAIFFALVAGLEVPVMLGMGALLARYRRRTLIAAGAVLYGLFLILLPVLLTSPLVWLLVLPAALGGGVILSLPLAYLQDLMAGRPGAGGSLLAVQRVISNGIAALVFAGGTLIGGYGLVAALSGVGMLLSVAFYLWLDRDGRPEF